MNMCVTVCNSTWSYWGLVSSPSHFRKRMETSSAQYCWRQIVGMSSYFSTEVLQSHDCTGPAGYKMEKPAGLSTCQCTENLSHPSRPCTNCAWKLWQLSLQEWALRHCWAPPDSTLTSAHGSQHATRQLSSGTSTTVAAKLSGPKNKTNKSSLPSYFSLLAWKACYTTTCSLYLFHPVFWQTTYLFFSHLPFTLLKGVNAPQCHVVSWILGFILG